MKIAQITSLGNQFDQTIQRYKALVYPRRHIEYRRWLRQQTRTSPTHPQILGQPLVVFDFRDNRIDGPQGRRFYGLFIFFIRNGFHPVFTDNYLVLGNIQEKFKQLCLREDFSILSHEQDLADGYTLVTDKWYSSLSRRAGKIITINYQPDYSTSDACFPMPFPLFPSLYATGEDLRLQDYRNQQRQWKIFFGGDAEAKKYNKKSIRKIYNKLSRAQILEILSAGLPKELLLELTSEETLRCAEQAISKGVVIMNTRHCKVASEKWLGTIARADFFLACPGVRYPMSHNLIEAMAVGTIPITQYPELFFPALEQGKNCLVFTSAAELPALIHKARAMEDQERAAMKANVQRYYDEFLSPQSTITRLLAHRPKHISLRLLPFLKPGGGFA
uniref:glycosyltransferase n=1 Tax=Cellvibrio fontiphilus TaxID=1815559 RepID=UPI002B4C1F99|nr:glycosyltransferase [Cellvibrio fontiphilus]